jgi:hypothetical protein
MANRAVGVDGQVSDPFSSDMQDSAKSIVRGDSPRDRPVRLTQAVIRAGPGDINDSLRCGLRKSPCFSWIRSLGYQPF